GIVDIANGDVGRGVRNCSVKVRVYRKAHWGRKGNSAI
nr:hypothetical protein [Tanacetum cinerariifolium]